MFAAVRFALRLNAVVATHMQYIHYALYTSYALMGWGIGVIIVVSFMLSADLEHAKKVIPRPKLEPDDGVPVPVRWMHHLHVSLRTRILRVHTLQEGEVQIKPWVMRLYYHDALIFKRLLDGTCSQADCVQTLVYFKADELQAARLQELNSGQPVVKMPRKIPDTQEGPDTRAEGLAEAAGDEGKKSEDEEAPYCPTMIHLRLFVIEVDCAMRVLHLLIYGLVLFGRYMQIMNDSAPDFDCNDLITYFANSD